MLELADHHNPRIPNWVALDKAIPGYSSMGAQDKTHYEGLYVLACHPELLQQPPEDIRDLHALVYFIFQYNLTYLWIDGKYKYQTAIFNPVEWAPESGLNMHMKTGLYAPLIDELAPLRPSVSLYFLTLLLSLVLICANGRDKSNYRLLFTLLTDLMDGTYDSAKESALKSQKNDLEESWLVDYLPNPASVAVNPNDKIAEGVKEFLLGGFARQGIFSPPEAPRVIPVEEDSPRSRPKPMCFIL